MATRGSYAILGIIPFPDKGPSVMPTSRRAINQSCFDMQEMNPYFMVASLVGRLVSKNFMVSFESNVYARRPLNLGTGWLDEATYISPFSWNATWSPQCCRAIWNWQVRACKASSTMMSRRWSSPDFRRHAALLKSSATMSTERYKPRTSEGSAIVEQAMNIS